jgi:hypothetical protein
VLLLAAPVFAAPVPCTDPAWLASAAKFYDFLTGMTCDDLGSVQASGVTLRVVEDDQHKLSDSDAADFKALTLSSAQAALSKYKALSPWLTYQNVTFVLSPSVFGYSLAAADLGLGTECLVTVLTEAQSLKDPVLRQTALPAAIAHELVHCVQHWNMPQQLVVKKDFRAWWSEGAADLLSHTVFENKAGVMELAGTFEAQSTTPLTRLDYPGYVFFAWYAQKKGDPGAVFTLMTKMPTSGDEQTQRATLLANVGQENLQVFARAYVDGTIATPQGWTLPKPMLPQTTFSGDDTRTQTGATFGVTRGQLVFQDGEYTLTASSTGTPDVKYKSGGGAWGSPPATAGGCPDPVVYAGFSTGTADPKLTFTAKKLEQPMTMDCQAPPVVGCQALGEKDPCLAGNWVLDATAAEQLVNAALGGDPNPKAVINGDSVVQLTTADGGAHLAYSDFDLVVGEDDPASLYETTLHGAIDGDWSTSGGVFRVCPSSDTVVLDTSVQLFLGTDNPKAEASFTGAEVRDLDYTCSGDTLTLKGKGQASTTANGAPLIWVYKRAAGKGCSAVPAGGLLFAAAGLLLRRRRRT